MLYRPSTIVAVAAIAVAAAVSASLLISGVDEIGDPTAVSVSAGTDEENTSATIGVAPPPAGPLRSRIQVSPTSSAPPDRPEDSAVAVLLPLFKRLEPGESINDAAPEVTAESTQSVQSEEPAQDATVDVVDEPQQAAPPLRVRKPISDERFSRFVSSRQFDEVSTIADGVVHGRYIEQGQRINVLLVHRSGGARLAVSPGGREKATVGQWAAEVGAVAAVNGNWFEPFDGPAVSGGVAYGGRDHRYTALFGFTADGDLATDHHRKTRDSVDKRVVEGVAGHPTLILDRVVTTDFGGDPTFTSRHPRTAIGATGSVDVLLLVTVDGRSKEAKGMTGLETARLMERLDAHHAVMLDGGGSSAMWIAGQGMANTPSDPGRRVGNQIAVLSGDR